MTSAETSPPLAPGSLDTALRVVAAGVVCGFLAVIQSSGFGLFLLGGGAHALSPTAIGMAIFATAVTSAVAALTSSVPGVVSIAQTVPIAALTTGVAAILAVDGAGGTAAASVVAFVALASIAFGGTALLIGGFRWGRFIRFVPYPVIAGFFAGCGWLIMLGGIGVAMGHRLGPGSLDLAADASVQLRLLVTLAIVLLILILILTRRFPVSVVLPGIAAGVIVAYNAAALAMGFAPAAARADGWLVAFVRDGALWPPIPPADLAFVDWEAVGTAAIHLPVAVILSVLTVLMNASAIELATRRDFDLDRELRSVGWQNLAGGAGGGLPGFHSVPLTLLAARLRAPGVGVGLIAAAVCVAALAFGDIVLAVVPTPLFAGLVAWVGLSLVIDWLLRSFPRLPVWEYLVVVVLILLVIATTGFVWGLLVGVMSAAVLFVVEYGRVEIVRHVLTGRDYQTGGDGSEARRRALQAAGDAILIVRLQGFLFFGTADRMRRRIQRLIEAPGRAPVRYLLIDFRRVSGLDSSTVMSLTRLVQMTGPERFTLVLSGMSEAIGRAMAKGGLVDGPDSHVRFVADLDQGLAACEDELLAGIAPELAARRPVPLADTLAVIIGERRLAEALTPYLDRVEIEAGGTLIEEGAPSDDIFFIEAGRAVVMLTAGEERLRLASVGPGAIAGEMAFYLGNARSASVVAETPLVAWRLSADSLRRLEIDSPETLIRFHRGMAAILADRLTGANRLVRLLAD